MIQIIVSMTRDGVIGNAGDQPWHLSPDLANFKAVTLGHTVIMGRKTYETAALSRPLPDRHNIILSRTVQEIPGTEVCTSIEDALAKAALYGREVFIIGGAQVYEQFLPLAQRLHISWVKGDFAGDTYFPPYNPADWVKVTEKDFEDFTYVTYNKKNA